MDENVKKFLYNGSLTGRLMHAYHLLLSAKVPLEDAVICRDAVDFVAAEERKRLAAFDTIGFLKEELGHERRRVAQLDKALKTARREAREEAAKEIECNCPGRSQIASLPPNGGERWRLCPEANCRAILAADIRALNEKEGK